MDDREPSDRGSQEKSPSHEIEETDVRDEVNESEEIQAAEARAEEEM